jgi:hypothetical protein
MVTSHDNYILEQQSFMLEQHPKVNEHEEPEEPEETEIFNQETNVLEN